MTRARRGQATVELAVCMLLLVPIFLYVLFLDDLLRYKLELQENVISMPWDLTTIDYEQDSQGTVDGRVTKAVDFVQSQFCDHTSVYDSYNRSYDCGGQEHHRAVSAHLCFLVGGGKGKEVSCAPRQPNIGANLDQPLDQAGIGVALRDSIQRGGFYVCDAKAGVVNYFLPNKIFMSFTNVEMSGVAYHYGDIDEHGVGTHGVEAGGGSVFALQEQRFSLITDTWALTRQPIIDTPNGQGGNESLYKRVNTVFSTGMVADARKTAIEGFVMMAMGNGLLNPTVMSDNGSSGDDTSTPDVTFTTAMGPEQNGYYSSHWKDWDRDKVEATGNARQDLYMGKPQPTGP